MTIEVSVVAKGISLIREKRPLVHNITNFVVMEFTANALLAFGASPVMAHAREEVEEMCSIASALVLNIGTLSADWVESMLLAQATAHGKKTPIVLDPVGSGATRYRTTTAKKLLSQGVSVLRGNGSEIASLAAADVKTRGVDSTLLSGATRRAAQTLSASHNCCVVVSGETDFVIDGKRVASIQNGSALMSRVTGMGCAATALIGACLGAGFSAFDGAITAMTAMGIAGEIAEEQSNGLGSFKTAFLDTLSNLDETTICRRARISDGLV